MSRINQFLILVFAIFSFGCFKKTAEERGLSLIPVSSFGYRGQVERSLKLKFLSDKGDVSTLTAEIESPFDYDFPVEFTWQLGQDVHLLQGELKGELAHLKKDTPVQLQIKVSNYNDTKTNRFVRFEAIGTNKSKRIFADGVFSAQPEQSFEKLVQEIEAYKKSNH